MAQRRMFSKSVTTTARFLQMPASTRLLYYDLGMSADDDGFVESFSILRMTNASEDDLRLLQAKGYIQIINDELTARICDWTINNQIRRDRYTPSIYHHLLPDDDKLATFGEHTDNQQETSGKPNGNQTETNGKHSTGKVNSDKDNLGKDNIDNTPRNKKFIPPTVQEVQQYCRECGFTIDAGYFVDYYTANGWMVGKQKMKDWKSAVRNWNRNQKKGGQSYGQYSGYPKPNSEERPRQKLKSVQLD